MQCPGSPAFLPLQALPQRARCFLFALIYPPSRQQAASPAKAQTVRCEGRSGAFPALRTPFPGGCGGSSGAEPHTGWTGCTPRSSPGSAAGSPCHLRAIKCLHTLVSFFLGAATLCCRHVAVVADPRIARMNNFSGKLAILLFALCYRKLKSQFRQGNSARFVPVVQCGRERWEPDSRSPEAGWEMRPRFIWELQFCACQTSHHNLEKVTWEMPVSSDLLPSSLFLLIHPSQPC